MDSEFKRIVYQMLPFVNQEGFKQAWKEYIEYNIAVKSRALESTKYGDESVFALIAEIKTLRQLVELVERVNDSVTNLNKVK